MKAADIVSPSVLIRDDDDSIVSETINAAMTAIEPNQSRAFKLLSVRETVDVTVDGHPYTVSTGPNGRDLINTSGGLFSVIEDFSANKMLIRNNTSKQIEVAAEAVDRAAIARVLPATPLRGGIDLNSRALNLESSGQKVNIAFDPAMIAQFKRGDFSGVRIQILNVVPIKSNAGIGIERK